MPSNHILVQDLAVHLQPSFQFCDASTGTGLEGWGDGFVGGAGAAVGELDRRSRCTCGVTGAVCDGAGGIGMCVGVVRLTEAKPARGSCGSLLPLNISMLCDTPGQNDSSVKANTFATCSRAVGIAGVELSIRLSHSTWEINSISCPG